MKHSGTTFWIEQTQNIIGKGQLCDMFNDAVNKRVSKIYKKILFNYFLSYIGNWLPDLASKAH